MIRTGLFGGTFNPPHTGHMSAAAEAVRSLGLDRLVIMPTGTPPHKKMGAGTPDADARFEMTKLAASGVPCAEVSDEEIRRGGKSYTADTVRALIAAEPDAELWLIMGEDMLFSFERWYDSRWLMDNVNLAVFARSGRLPEIYAHAEHLRSLGANVRVVEKEVIEISSTKLRAELPKRGGREYLSDDVYSYIIRSRLYGALPDMDWLRGKAMELLKPSRVAHVLGTEETAAKMALRWGADENDARTAALLHDCTKRLTSEEQLKFDSLRDTMSIAAIPEKLFHAVTGAELAQREFGVSDELRDAIRWHTSGRPGMSILEKIIYLADMIEPNRDFEGVERLRGLCFENIDRAMCEALEISVASIRQRKLPEDAATLHALDYYRGITK